VPPSLQLLTIAAAIAGAFLLFFSVAGLLRVIREAEVLRVPARTDQMVSFQEPGSYVLHVSHPRLSTALRNASYSLRSAAGQEVKSSPSIFRTTVSGVSSVRISVRNFEIAQPGSYRLVVSGVAPDADLSRNELVFTRPFGAALFARIVGTIAGAALLIGGVVLTALKSAGKL